MPITWKNVNGRSDAVAADFMRQAGSYFNKGLNSAQGIVDDQSERVQKRDMTAFNEALARYQTPEELAAAQESGDIANLRSQLQYLDPNKTGADAIRNRLTGLREQETADYNYDQVKADRAEDPLVGQFTARLNGIRAGRDMGTAFETLRSDLQGQVDSGKLRAETAADILAQTDQRQNNLTTRFRNNQEYQRGETERQRTNSINSMVTTAIDGFDRENDTVTSGLKALRAQYPEWMTPAQRQEADQLFEARVNARGQIAEGDRKYLDATFRQIDKDYKLDGNIYSNHDPKKAQQYATDTIEEFTQKTEDGDRYFLGIKDRDTRKRATTDLRRLAAEGVDMGDGIRVPVPNEMLRDLVGNLKDTGWVYDNYDNLAEAASELMNSSDFYYEQYRNWDDAKKAKIQAENQAYSTLSQGRPGSQSNPLGLPQPSTEQAQQETAPQSSGSGNGGSPLILREPEVNAPTTPNAALDALNNMPDWQAGNQQTPSKEEVRGQIAGFIDAGSPAGRGMYAVADFVNGIRERNAKATIEKGQKAFQDLLSSNEKLSNGEFVEFATRNGMALKSLPAKELNKLRDIYGESLVNRFIDPR